MMKFTLIRRDEKNQLHVTKKTAEAFMERIKTDTKSGDVAGLRRHLQMTGGSFSYVRMCKLPTVYPSAELGCDANGNVVMNRMNGVLVLSIGNVRGGEAQRHVKEMAMTMPSTLAAFVGSSGKSVKILVRVGRADGVLPQTEQEADRFLAAAFTLVKLPYQALLGVQIDHGVPTVTTGFRMTMDETPLYNPNATPFVAEEKLAASFAQATAGQQQQMDIDLYAQYEHLYKQAMGRLWEQLSEDADDEAVLAELARQLCLAGFPEEEAVTHIWAHYRYRMPQPFSENHVRAVIGAVFAETKPDRKQAGGKMGTGREMLQLMQYLQSRYVFRYNTIMGYTEYHPTARGCRTGNRWTNGWSTALPPMHAWQA